MASRLSFPSRFSEDRIFIVGGAFLKIEQLGDEKPKNRYWFVMNLNPETDDEIYLVTATTKIIKRKRVKGERADDVIVVINTNEYEPLTQKSAVDCDTKFIKTKTEIKRAIENHECTILQPLPENILQKLRKAISLSSNVEARYKELVLPPEEESEL